jgi:formylglycine-generating enzyme required for sulfatase activity
MGTDNGDARAKPVHKVSIKNFEMSKTLVTVEQYEECVIKGGCTPPSTGKYCNWENHIQPVPIPDDGWPKRGHEKDPVTCVDWYQATAYAKFMSHNPKYVGARLPSEAEWEYAARSRGKNQKYPWGNEDATCERAVMQGNGGMGCGSGGTMPVLSENGKECARKAGQTQQGLCDMAGNVSEWVQDTYPDPETNQGSYVGAPTNGSAFESVGDYRVMRGGCFYGDAELLRSDYRSYSLSSFRPGIFGFRLARSSR